MIPAGYYDPQRHKVIAPNDFVKYVQKEFNAPDVGAVFDNRTGNWLLVEWIDGFKRGRISELMVLGRTPYGDRAMVRSLESMVRGSDAHHRVRSQNRDILRNFERRAALRDEEDYADYQEAGAAFGRRPGCTGSSRIAVPG